MGVEAVIDGKKCFFTADNFYHQDMFAGTGGWMGLNRAFPPYYAASAKTVLDAAPDACSLTCGTVMSCCGLSMLWWSSRLATT